MAALVPAVGDFDVMAAFDADDSFYFARKHRKEGNRKGDNISTLFRIADGGSSAEAVTLRPAGTASPSPTGSSAEYDNYVVQPDGTSIPTPYSTTRGYGIVRRAWGAGLRTTCRSTACA